MTRYASKDGTETVSKDEARTILRLRLLLARAANRDSMGWWDDESLTPHAAFVRERIFPIAPGLGARSLALTAAMARHQAACAGRENALHLYRLDPDGQDALAVRSIPLLTIPFPKEPILSVDALRRELLAQQVQPAPYTAVHRTENGGLLIQIPPAPAGASPLLHRARTLAWAYLEGTPSQPVIPFCTE